MNGPLSTLAAAVDSGEVCVSLPACPWLAGLLRLLPLTAASAAAPAMTARQPARRLGHRRRAPPLPGSLLTRICVWRT